MGQSQEIVANFSVAEESNPVTSTKKDVDGNALGKKQSLGKCNQEYIPAPVEPHTKRPYANIPGTEAVKAKKMRKRKKNKGVFEDFLGYVKK